MKRSRIKDETRESKALKKMRVSRGLSQRESAEKIGVPSTMVNHTENGRAYIKKEYIKKFLEGLDYSWGEWVDFVEEKSVQINLKDSCKSIIDGLEDSRVRVIYNLLVNF